ncbi:hypothetical protein [Actinomycetospora sp. TBRC 11914]|uniref:hypothetical protein n=1 Tax=Actinomycetospora sp. TBRC 11914 TaxID=2729387 RepID=UPI00145EB5B9|nr:hypothetical protein [Actinomycetospora sp. TBRC 11914]NMO88642.1 hypothetical protein [Actinomycetospora sp. TBRC 11914]
MSTTVDRGDAAPEDAERGAPPRAGSRADTAVAVGVPTVLVGLHLLVYGRWIVDDAGITMAYARSIATGAGPVLQPGAAPSEGWSDPAWLAVLVVGRWLGLVDHGAWFGVPDLVAFPKVLAVLCSAGIFWAFHRVAVRVARSPVTVTVLAGALTAAAPPYVVWIGSGLENPLLAVVVVVLAARLVTAALDGRLLEPRVAVTCGLLAGLAALTRPDGAVYLLAHPLAVLVTAGSAELRVRRLRAAATSFAAGAAPVVLYEIWRLAEFGALLPTTARAKQQGVLSTLDLARPADLVGLAGWLACLVVAGAVGVVLSRRSAPAAVVVRVLLVPLGLALLAYAVLAADWMALARFATPVWPLLALVAVVSVAAVLPERRSTGRRVLVGVLVVAALSSAVSWTTAAASFRARPTLPLCEVTRSTAETIDAGADALGVRSGSVLGVDAGGVALGSRLRFVDLAGLTDPVIAGYWARGDMAGLRDHLFEQVRPTFMRLWKGWNIPEGSGLFTDPRLDRDYELIWTNDQGGRTYVRRDAVPDGDHLADAQLVSQQVMDALLVSLNHAGPTSWTCGAAVRPSPYGTAAATAARGG